MLKWFGLTGIALLLAAVVLVTRYDKLHGTSGQGYDVKCVQPNDPSTVPVELVCTIEHSQKAQGSKYEPDWWHVFLAWPEGVTAWLLLLTLLAISLQTWHTRKAADAALDSIHLQQAAMVQWIDVETLGCYIQEPPSWKRDSPFTINLRFEALNNTAYPFDIRKIVTKIGMWADDWEVFTVETNVTLAPQEKTRTARYAFYVPTQSITEEWFRSGTVVTVNGEITFKSCLGKMQTDYFGGLYRCGQIDGGQEGMFTYMESLGITPERREEHVQSPNPN